jgi:hypothetical protein
VDDAASPEVDGDGVLAQFGTFDFDGVRELWAGLTRQFIEADDADVMWQLRCTFRWTPGAETEALGSGDLWSFGMPLDKFSPRLWPFPAGPGRWQAYRLLSISQSSLGRSNAPISTGAYRRAATPAGGACGVMIGGERLCPIGGRRAREALGCGGATGWRRRGGPTHARTGGLVRRWLSRRRCVR